MTTPAGLEREHTLTTAVARYNELQARDLLAPAADDSAGDSGAGDSGAGDSGDGHRAEPGPLSQGDALELLALGEAITRKAAYGRQLAVRSARMAGASWSQIGAALGTTKQSAWEAHNRWIDVQAEHNRRRDYEGLDDQEAAAARDLAGNAADDRPFF
jgi:hypothetical protein